MSRVKDIYHREINAAINHLFFSESNTLLLVANKPGGVVTNTPLLAAGRFIRRIYHMDFTILTDTAGARIGESASELRNWMQRRLDVLLPYLLQ